jgi:DNA invertase Pin-like site-specific DNA recombinase
MTVVEWFYDPGVSGADPIETRPGFSTLLDRIEDNGVRAAVVEDASRFARDLVAQELDHLGPSQGERLAPAHLTLHLARASEPRD